MASENKKRKTNKKNHPGIGRKFLKNIYKLKGVCFYNSSLRMNNKKQLYKILKETL